MFKNIILCQHLTVMESMNVAANLKLGERMPQAEKDLVVAEILDTLGLTEWVLWPRNLTATMYLLPLQGVVIPEPKLYQVDRGRGLQLHWSWSTTLLLCSLMSQQVVWTPHPVTHVLHFSKSWRGRAEPLFVQFISHQQGKWIWTTIIRFQIIWSSH